MISGKYLNLKLGVIISIVVFGLTLQFAVAPPVIAKTKLSFGTAPLGGTWYVLSGGLAELFNKEIPEVNITVVGGGGGTINAKKLSSGDIDMGFGDMEAVTMARKGSHPFTKKYDYSKVRSIVLMHSSPAHWCVLKNSPIKSMTDMKGKRVSIGPRGSGLNQKARYALDACGLKKDVKTERDQDFLVKLEYIGDDQGAEALADGRLDVYVESGGVPLASVLNLAATKEIRFLQMTQAQEDRLMKRVPHMVPTVVAPNTYKGQTEPIRVFGASGCLFVQENVSADIVYKMCKAIDENWNYLYTVHKAFKIWKFHKNIEQITGQPLHPGALKFYKEKGIL